MKVILKENVENLGRTGDIVKVAPGYARNFLIPRGFAAEATLRNEKALEHARKHLEYKRNKEVETAKQLAAKIEAIQLVLPHQAGEEGKLFGSVTNMELAEQLKAQGVEIDRKKIAIDPIKAIGDYTASIKLHPEVTANLKVSVTKG